MARSEINDGLPAADTHSTASRASREDSQAGWAGPYGEYDENGVDLSLIRSMLSKTPLERLVLMEQHAQDTRVLMEYGRRHRETKTSQNC